jgi:pimeloyl-ACP methyl ester carboxylesterase
MLYTKTIGHPIFLLLGQSLKKLISLLLFIKISFYTFAQQRDSVPTGNFFYSFDSARIYYEVKGNGIPVILVHGFIVNGESWKKTAVYTDLLTAGYKVITLDMRGNGQSDKPHDTTAYKNDAEAKDIMALAKLLSLKKYHVLGYSRGSIITSRLLILDKRVSKVIMGGMGADFTNPLWPRRILFYKALMGEPVKELEGALNYVKEKGLDQLALALLQKEQPITSKKEFGKVKKPVLVICGDKDTDNGNGSELAGLIPNAVFESVPGDHNGSSKTAEFSKAVIDFLKKKY